MKRGDDRFDRMSNLAARIGRFDSARAARRVVPRRPKQPAKATISPREKAIRRWTLAIILGWSLLVYGLILVQRWGQASVLELALGFCFALVCALGIYGFFLFYAELGKTIWHSFRRRSDGE